MKAPLRKLTGTWPLVIFLLLPVLTRAETAVQAWVQRYNGPANGDDQAYAVAVDTSNNVIVAGYSVRSGSGYDYTTIKYSSEGLPLWTNRYNGTGAKGDQAYAVVVDGADSAIVAGLADGAGSLYDYVTIKYSSAGVALWTNRYNGPGNGDDQARAMVMDRSNNVIVTGWSVGTRLHSSWATGYAARARLSLRAAWE